MPQYEVTEYTVEQKSWNIPRSWHNLGKYFAHVCGSSFSSFSMFASILADIIGSEIFKMWQQLNTQEVFQKNILY